MTFTDQNSLNEQDNTDTDLQDLKLKLRQANDALRLLKETTESYINLSEVILVALDTQAKITMIGGNSLKILGYESEELVGKEWFKVCLPPQEYDRVNIAYQITVNYKAQHL